ncbi:MAG: SDR family NAD(P)-dependent oxidoreductase [Proteobacteria bacterium]|nr:SDR family NAD(P)-dependent oxidoreductase [Pseudomonadota bacterium]
MKDVQGRVAVVTGGASGIGRGMAESFAAAGMKLVLADVEEEALQKTAEAIRAGSGESAGVEVLAVPTDVSQAEQVEALARRTLDAFGAVHVLCNNAGVAVGGVPTWESTLDDWNWILGVNLMGVVHGIRSFVPILIEQGEEGHVVNTASIAGLMVNGGNALYGVTKHAVVALSESMHIQLQTSGPKVKVSVLCPGFIRTRILESERNRPAELAETKPIPDTPLADAARKMGRQFVEQGLDPREVGDLVLRAIREERFYVLTHTGPIWKGTIQQRMENILAERDPEPPLQEHLAELLEDRG